MKTYSLGEVVEMFRPGRPDAWLRRGTQRGKFPCLKVGRDTRFTDDHIKQIAAVLEKQAKPQERSAPADVAVMGATSRSAKRHRNRAS
ncbi:hypothetical protein ACWEF6_02935 [Amycolatopsis sp. NPDC004772]